MKYLLILTILTSCSTYGYKRGGQCQAFCDKIKATCMGSDKTGGFVCK